MSNFLTYTLAEIKTLGAWCMIHGPEARFVITVACIFSTGLILGMWLAALLGANGRDDDDR